MRLVSALGWVSAVRGCCRVNRYLLGLQGHDGLLGRLDNNIKEALGHYTVP